MKALDPLMHLELDLWPGSRRFLELRKNVCDIHRVGGRRSLCSMLVQHVPGDPEEVCLGTLDRVQAVHPQEPEEDLLHEIRNLRKRVAQAGGEKAMQRIALPSGQVMDESVFFLGLHSVCCSNLPFLEYMCVGGGRTATGGPEKFLLGAGFPARRPDAERTADHGTSSIATADSTTGKIHAQSANEDTATADARAGNLSHGPTLCGGVPDECVD